MILSGSWGADGTGPEGRRFRSPTAATSGRVLVIDRTTRKIVRKIIHTIDVGGKPRRIAFSADGLTAFVANELGWVDVLK